MSKLSPWKSVARVSQRDALEAERCSISLSDPCRNISARSPGPPMIMMTEFLVFSSCNQSGTKLLRRRRCHSRGCAMKRCLSPFPSLCIPGTRYLKRGLVPYVSPPLAPSTKVTMHNLVAVKVAQSKQNLPSVISNQTFMQQTTEFVHQIYQAPSRHVFQKQIRHPLPVFHCYTVS
ncbi:hypothetical protein O6H91_24G003700 [Diphasiastrum complanatum]|uniref:Uncharacterized protein n=1 Tax=Diphasiastrum complanatum TaxID=34168 RepID=A0ACC2A7A8_DIPCM|nr:hypothetical protein O6H91_24G003700 [Diphasiastrum complanatum]